MFDSSRDCLGRWRFRLLAPSSSRLWRFGWAKKPMSKQRSKLCFIAPDATALRAVANTLPKWNKHRQKKIMETKTTSSNLGVVASVRGSVVDMRFDGPLPPINSVLRTGAEKQIVIEVLAQRDARHVRGIALTPTQGLARGMVVTDTGGPLKAPVGKAIRSEEHTSELQSLRHLV